MIVKDERRTNWHCEYDQIEQLPQMAQDLSIVFNQYLNRRAEMHNIQTHNRLHAVLVEHIATTCSSPGRRGLKD